MGQRVYADGMAGIKGTLDVAVGAWNNTYYEEGDLDILILVQYVQKSAGIGTWTVVKGKIDDTLVGNDFDFLFSCSLIAIGIRNGIFQSVDT